MILNGLENGLIVSGDDALTLEVIREKLNHWYKTLDMNDEKRGKEMAVGAYNKQ